MLTDEQKNKLNIRRVYDVKKWDIKDNKEKKYLYFMLQTFIENLDKDDVPYRFGSKVNFADFEVVYNKDVSGYEVMFLCSWENKQTVVPQYAHFLLRCDQTRYSNLSEDDWFDIFYAYMNGNNPDKEKYTKSFVDMLLTKVS